MSDNTILLIDHHENPKDDTVSMALPDLGFKTELLYPFKGDTLPDDTNGYSGCVIFGGAQNVAEKDQFPFLKSEIKWIELCMEENLPTLGICLGAQLIAHTLGASVGPHQDGLCEFGYYPIQPTEAGEEWLGQTLYATQAHYQGFELPSGATLLATGETFENQAFRYEQSTYAVQFHPEVTPEIFKRWQDSDWAMFNDPGSQDRETQNRILEAYGHIQSQWLVSFLQELFADQETD